jgi:WD40 repeat protein
MLLMSHSLSAMDCTNTFSRSVAAREFGEVAVYMLLVEDGVFFGEVNGMAVTPDGKRAVSASDDHTLKVWDLENGRALHTLEGHSNWVRGVAVTGDGRRDVSASGDHTLKLWDLETARCIATFICDAFALCWAAAGDLIVAGDSGGRVYFLRLVE